MKSHSIHQRKTFPPRRMAEVVAWTIVVAGGLALSVRWLSGVLGSVSMAVVLVGVALLTLAPFAGDRGHDRQGRHTPD